MKKIKLFCSLIIFSLIISCGSDNNEVDTDGGIIADFSFTNNENLFEFTNLSEGATSYRWDLGDLSFYCEKENPTFRYTKVGGEIKVTLTAINDQGNEASITKVIIAPEVFDINIAIDGSFDDWQNVAVLYDESESGTGSMQKIKMWGVGDNINIYVEGNTTMLMELVDIFIDADGDSSTGFLSWQWPEGSGAEFLFEGPLLSNSWGAFYQHTDPNGGWGWAALAGSGANMSSSGIVSIDAETNAIEFSIPKTQLGTLDSKISLAITELNSGWQAVATFPEVSGTSRFVTYELPIESSGSCE
jgi:PKD repeat protein